MSDPTPIIRFFKAVGAGAVGAVVSVYAVAGGSTLAVIGGVVVGAVGGFTATIAAFKAIDAVNSWNSSRRYKKYYAESSVGEGNTEEPKFGLKKLKGMFSSRSNNADASTTQKQPSAEPTKPPAP